MPLRDERVMQLDDDLAKARGLPFSFAMELGFPGYIRTHVVASIAFEWEEREPGFIHALPLSLAIECAYVDNAVWDAVNDPIVVLREAP